MSKLQLQSSQALDRLGHEGIFLRLAYRQVCHREAQVWPGVVPGDAADRLLLNEELANLLRVGEGSAGARLRGADVEEIRPVRHLRLEADLAQGGDELL